jgi:hypothetical protein
VRAFVCLFVCLFVCCVVLCCVVLCCVVLCCVVCVSASGSAVLYLSAWIFYGLLRVRRAVSPSWSHCSLSLLVVHFC